MVNWKNVRVPEPYSARLERYGKARWNTRSPSEALRLVLEEYFAALGDPLVPPDVQWGGSRGGGRPRKQKP